MESLSVDAKLDLIIRMLAQQQDLIHELVDKHGNPHKVWRLNQTIKELRVQLVVQKSAYDELAKFIEPKDLP